MSVEPTTTVEQAPVGRKAERYPPQIKYIIGNEAAERFGYYGIVGILELYLVKKLGLSDANATETQAMFGAAVYFLPLLGGWLADRWLGRYWTILSISLVYCMGNATLALFEGNRTGLYVGLALVAFGAGGIKPCVSAFVGDQFRTDQQHLLTRIYGWFYWAINLGAAAAFFIVPFLHDDRNYRWAFGVPGIAMAFATLVFWLGSRHYVRQPPARGKDRKRLLPVVWYALTNQRSRKSGEKFFDVALAEYSREEVEGVRAVLGILVIFATVPFFWALFNQVNSTWVLQGRTMTGFLKVGDSYIINAETMQGSESVLVMIWVPILTLWVYPWLERRGVRVSALRRMGAGMVLGGLAFVLSAILQTFLDRGATLSVTWQFLPAIVLEAGEVLLSATALEFAFSQAPAQFKSIIMSCWLMTIACGHFLIFAFTYLNDNFVHLKGALWFYVYAVMMLLVAAAFIFLATRYRERQFSPAPASGS